MPMFYITHIINKKTFYIEGKNLEDARNNLSIKADNEKDFIIYYEEIFGKGSYSNLEKIPKSKEERLSIFYIGSKVDFGKSSCGNTRYLYNSSAW